jgi:xanthine dehydrogenase YagR molybdenum-binding subunit
MGNLFFDNPNPPELDRVDGKAKVTGKARYAAEHQFPNLVYGVLVTSTVAKGTIKSIESKSAERAPGVLAVISHLNSPKIPAYYDAGGNPVKGTTGGQELRIFTENKIYFSGQPVVLVIADTLERAVYAASLVKLQYNKEAHVTDVKQNQQLAAAPGPRFTDYKRGEENAYKSAPVKIEAEYLLPLEVHNPMELHSTLAIWDGDDKVTVYEKTQGVKSSQRSIMNAFKLPAEKVQVYAEYVGGGFGSALRTWPHAIAAVMGAKKVGRPLKLMLTRDQMFTMVGYRPYTIQKMGLGATQDGKLTGITHEAVSQTSTYEMFTEGTVNVSRFLYACPNVNTSYKILPVNLSTPTWMRGPGEATGAYAIESAMDELAFALNMDPVELRLKNYAEIDQVSNRPYSSKFLKEAYAMGAEKIGWNKRNKKPASMRENGMLVGYGMGSGTFNASRGTSSATAKLQGDGTLLLQSAVSDSGPGTATTMTQIAASAFGLPVAKVKFELGDSSFTPGPTQGGSTTTSTLGSAVHETCLALKKKLADLALKEGAVFHTANLHNVKFEDLVFENGEILLASDRTKKISYSALLKQNNLNDLEVTAESKATAEAQKYAMLAFSVHYVKVLVNPLTGVVKVAEAVTVADGGTIVSIKQAESQMIGGIVAGIGMALTEEGVIDHRYGRWVNNNFADYHVPVNADVPKVEVLFVNKPDPVINPIGAKGIGEVSIVGFAAAVANAVFHATGKRVRELPITPDKVLNLD